MPNYDYQCPKCGHEFEVFQSMNDARLTKCPQKGCRGKVERKIGTGAGFVFKGSGFYITDYRSKAYSDSAKADKPPAEPATKSDTSSAKPDSSSSKPAASAKSE